MDNFLGEPTEKLRLFMQQHRPSYDWLRKHTSEEDIRYYINEQLKIFSKNYNKN
ncbi:hypothetical protein [Sediminibacterium sp.]|uniref:hypothetical protein n=1 Tax=Sediminibacterium sp. TaxID=1917865 RepID=UPI003F70D86E